jgi:hypothetical protein
MLDGDCLSASTTHRLLRSVGFIWVAAQQILRVRAALSGDADFWWKSWRQAAWVGGGCIVVDAAGARGLRLKSLDLEQRSPLIGDRVLNL